MKPDRVIAIAGLGESLSDLCEDIPQVAIERCTEYPVLEGDSRLTVGEIGCASAHYAVWGHVASGTAVVLEGDARVSPSRWAAWERVTDDFDVVILSPSGNIPNLDRHCVMDMRKANCACFSTAGYAITSHGAAMLRRFMEGAAATPKVAVPLPCLIWRVRYFLRVGITTNPVVLHHNVRSSTQLSY